MQGWGGRNFKRDFRTMERTVSQPHDPVFQLEGMVGFPGMGMTMTFFVMMVDGQSMGQDDP